MNQAVSQRRRELGELMKALGLAQLLAIGMVLVAIPHSGDEAGIWMNALMLSAPISCMGAFVGPLLSQEHHLHRALWCGTAAVHLTLTLPLYILYALPLYMPWYPTVCLTGGLMLLKLGLSGESALHRLVYSDGARSGWPWILSGTTLAAGSIMMFVDNFAAFFLTMEAVAVGSAWMVWRYCRRLRL